MIHKFMDVFGALRCGTVVWEVMGRLVLNWIEKDKFFVFEIWSVLLQQHCFLGDINKVYCMAPRITYH